MTTANAPKMQEVQTILMNTLRNLCDRTNPMDLDRARAVGEVASVMVSTVKVGIDYLKATGQDSIPFLEQATPTSITAVPVPPVMQANGITSIMQHKIKG